MVVEENLLEKTKDDGDLKDAKDDVALRVLVLAMEKAARRVVLRRAAVAAAETVDIVEIKIRITTSKGDSLLVLIHIKAKTTPGNRTDQATVL